MAEEVAGSKGVRVRPGIIEALKRASIIRVRQLVQERAQDLLAIEGINEESLAQLNRVLQTAGIYHPDLERLEILHPGFDAPSLPPRED